MPAPSFSFHLSPFDATHASTHARSELPLSFVQLWVRVLHVDASPVVHAVLVCAAVPSDDKPLRDHAFRSQTIDRRIEKYQSLLLLSSCALIECLPFLMRIVILSMLRLKRKVPCTRVLAATNLEIQMLGWWWLPPLVLLASMLRRVKERRQNCPHSGLLAWQAMTLFARRRAPAGPDP
jgi:hypothetical protein